MKKLILATFIICIAISPAFAKTDKIRKSTPSEIADCNEVLTNMVRTVANQKDFKKAIAETEQSLHNLEKAIKGFIQ